MVRGILPAPRPDDIMYSPLDVAITVSEQLTRRGHGVSFYAAGGEGPRVTDFNRSSLRPIVQNNQDWQNLLGSTDLFTDYLPSLYDQVLVQDMFKRASEGEYDLLHFHHPEAAMPYASLYPQVPVVYTLHDQLDQQRRETIEAFMSPNQHFISISDNQRRGAPDLPYAATVYNGIDTKLFAPKGEPEDYLLFVGRIVEYKGVKEAIQVAIKTKSRLLIIGQVQAADQWFFDTHVKPYLNDKILYLGMIDHDQLPRYYQKARALLMPVLWEEPFGLTMVEAMACGTPVLAFHRGSIPEVVVDGKTGYVVESVNAMAEALGIVDQIKRADCRKHVLANFSLNRMVDGYENIFYDIVAADRLGRLQRQLSGTVKRAARPLTKIKQNQAATHPVKTARNKIQGVKAKVSGRRNNKS